jgi:hypothetical protein
MTENNPYASLPHSERPETGNRMGGGNLDERPSLAVIRYNEPLNERELAFLEEKEAKERKQYFKVFQALMAGSFLIPFMASWYRAYDGAPNAFSYLKFFVSATILLTISAVAVYLSYKAYHKTMTLDIRDKTKTIETNRITKKVTIASKNAYYFYIDSAVKLSIEVTEEYFHSLNDGDEVSIEYTTHSKLYLGYF